MGSTLGDERECDPSQLLSLDAFHQHAQGVRGHITTAAQHVVVQVQVHRQHLRTLLDCAIIVNVPLSVQVPLPSLAQKHLLASVHAGVRRRLHILPPAQVAVLHMHISSCKVSSVSRQYTRYPRPTISMTIVFCVCMRMCCVDWLKECGLLEPKRSPQVVRVRLLAPTSRAERSALHLPAHTPAHTSNQRPH